MSISQQYHHKRLGQIDTLFDDPKAVAAPEIAMLSLIAGFISELILEVEGLRDDIEQQSRR